MPDHYDEMTPRGLRQEAAALRAGAERALLRAAELEDKAEGHRVVRVTYGGTAEYCFLIPGEGWLPNIGDLLTVSASDWFRRAAGNDLQIVTVTGYGRGGYKGELREAHGRVEVY